MLRCVLHDWSDAYCAKILRHLRAAAGDDTKLVLIENVLPYVCGDPSNVTDVPGASEPPAPAPLLPNFGYVPLLRYTGDLMVHLSCSSAARWS